MQSGETQRLTNGLIEWMRDVVMDLLVEIFQHLVTELELFCDTAVLRQLRLTHFLRHLSVREVLRRWWMDFALWPTVLLGATDDRYRVGRSSCSDLLCWRGGWRWRSGSFLHDGQLDLNVTIRLCTRLEGRKNSPPPEAEGSSSAYQTPLQPAC